MPMSHDSVYAEFDAISEQDELARGEQEQDMLEYFAALEGWD